MERTLFNPSCRSGFQLIAATLLLAFLITGNVSAYVLNANGSISQFTTIDLDTFTGTTNATVSVSGSSSKATYSASASAFQLSAQSSALSTGTHVSSAGASLSAAQIIFHDTQQLIDLGLTASGTLDILFNFDYVITQSASRSSLGVGDNTGVSTLLIISTAGGFIDSAAGSLGSANVVGEGGFFTGLPGTITVPVIDTSVTISRVVTLNPLLSGGGIIDFQANVGAISRGEDAHASILLSMFDDGNLLTLTDGTSLKGLGIDYTFVTPDTSTSVPEPITLALLSLGLFGLGFSRRRSPDPKVHACQLPGSPFLPSVAHRLRGGRSPGLKFQ